RRHELHSRQRGRRSGWRHGWRWRLRREVRYLEPGALLREPLVELLGACGLELRLLTVDGLLHHLDNMPAERRLDQIADLILFERQRSLDDRRIHLLALLGFTLLVHRGQIAAFVAGAIIIR